jgi:hypothetical protein
MLHLPQLPELEPQLEQFWLVLEQLSLQSAQLSLHLEQSSLHFEQLLPEPEPPELLLQLEPDPLLGGSGTDPSRKQISSKSIHVTFWAKSNASPGEDTGHTEHWPAAESIQAKISSTLNKAATHNAAGCNKS